MNLETVQAQLKLNEMKQRQAYLEAEASGLVTLIRLHVNLLHDDFTKMEVDEAWRAMERLREVIIEIKELKKRRAQMETAGLRMRI